jgi:DNA-directed RNA polymerase sigma subunit (sigma70/sigma32)
VTEGLDELSEREQDVLRVTALYQRAGDHQRLPNAISAELALRWETTNENIRAIRSRALKKLSDFVTGRMAQEKVQ